MVEIKPINIVSCAFSTAFMLIICTLAGFGLSLIPGLPVGFCPGAAIGIPFTMWFGIWGALAAYLETVISGLIKGFPLIALIPWSLNVFIQMMIPLLAFRLLKRDEALKNGKDLAVFVVFAWIINSLVSALWGAIVPTFFNIWPLSSSAWLAINYFVSYLIVIGAVSPLILKTLTVRVKNTSAYVKGIVS